MRPAMIRAETSRSGHLRLMDGRGALPTEGAAEARRMLGRGGVPATALLGAADARRMLLPGTVTLSECRAISPLGRIERTSPWSCGRQQGLKRTMVYRVDGCVVVIVTLQLSGNTADASVGGMLDDAGICCRMTEPAG